ncbi:uncharacterized protein BDR25DRAFT_344647 [Lindgomyces ingoldianus]|uniref:Uncharacterized protein n=1 Tax=Lindgomyces ingoldianus TaxID=673940 RepID=A0ACB6QP22_9PLEO|nr:uncharacterized protein BDR25DRAFT_344647 [Lindgomyces ingoldianus]KAF2467901.1 hypothetical protein BDR25DRAFT_344647 [Lindgomyces ingoldianus]
MAVTLPEEIANALIRGALLGAGEAFGANSLDLVQPEIKDTLAKPTLNNTCVFYMTGKPGTADSSVVNINGWLKCGDQSSLLGSWINVPANMDLKMTDPRVGDITVNFQPSKFPTFPWPGDAIIYNAAWTDYQFDKAVGIDNCIRDSGRGGIVGKDCYNKNIVVRVCTEGFADGSYGVINDQNIINHGWIYTMALPVQGVNPGCPNAPAKVKRTLSRFEVPE